MNILQVIPQLETGGAERTTLEVCEALIAKGHQCWVASEGGRMVDELEGAGGQLLSMPAKSKNPFVIWKNTARLTKLIKEEKIDLIHARSRAPAWSALWAARRSKIAFVTTYHGTYSAQSPLKRRYNAVMASGDRVIANSNFIADHVRSEHDVGEDRLRIIPRGVAIDQFDPVRVPPERRDSMRSKWGIRREDTAILLPARLSEWKGQAFFLDVMAQLGADPNIVLIYIGDSQGREAYRTALLAKAQALDIKLVLTGHEMDMPAAYMASNLTVCPSLQPEAFGRTAAEAQAMGVPVIASDHGGARESVIHNETGWRAEPGDLNAWMQAVRQALSQTRASRVAMGLTARSHIANNYSTTALQEATLKVYHELVN